MRNGPRGDVWKVWLYAMAVVALGAWISPLLYNAGKALDEVSSSRTTNGPLEWLGRVCHTADFPWFFEVGLWLAAVLLLFPWLRWLRAKPQVDAAEDGAEQEHLNLPEGERVGSRGSRWRKAWRGLWRGLWCGCAGFLVVAGLWLALAWALVPLGVFTPRQPAGGWVASAWPIWAGSVALALVMEVWFRGIAMGIFLRAMRPSAALGMNAAYFALLLAMIPPPGLHVADPEAAGTGFEMLRLVVWRFGEWQGVCQTLVPLLTLGVVLAYARWRMASLWLPIGMHTGWLFARGMHTRMLDTSGACESFLSNPAFQHGWIPMIVIVVAGVVAHDLTATHDDEPAARS